MSLGLYIHVPFCRARCHFCAFYLQIYHENRASAYLEALAQEVQQHLRYRTVNGRPFGSVYFGGGTPTALPATHLCGILRLIQDHFGLCEGAEVTVEAHPDTVDGEGLLMLRRAGFNRISFGVQSMEETALAQIGRRMVPGNALVAVGLAQTAGFKNINLDLMYGLPGQDLGAWAATLDAALALNPTHLSCYALTLEEGTRLQRDLARCDRETGPAVEIEMATHAARRLAAAGFQQYEISNFCLPSHACRHNLLYWTGGEYLGLGPSAQSYVGGSRSGNIDDLDEYRITLAAGRLPITGIEQLTPRQRRREAVVFGLRLLDGIDLPSVEIEAPEDSLWRHELERLVTSGLIQEASNRVKLTETGRQFADSVAVALL